MKPGYILNEKWFDKHETAIFWIALTVFTSISTLVIFTLTFWFADNPDAASGAMIFLIAVFLTYQIKRKVKKNEK